MSRTKLLSVIGKKFKGLCITSLDGEFNITIEKTGSPVFNLKYSFNGKNWYEFANSDTNTINTITLHNTGDKVYFKGSYSNQSTNNYISFSITGANPNNKGVNVSGDILSLLDENNFETMYDISAYPYAFYRLFYKNGLTTANSRIREINGLILKATTLSKNCYNFLFKYNNINYAHNLILPATILADECYYGFFETNYNLKTAPQLPATNLAYGCYRAMFSSCYLLEILPYLPATTLKTDCYRFMFNSVQNAKYLKIAYTGNFSSSYFNTWVGNLFSSSGDFYYNGTDTTVGISAIPSGWTVHTF